VKNAGETGIDCGGSAKATQLFCADGQGCVDSLDCVGTCNEGVCGPIGPKDGKKNQGETDVDCGGPNAPKCVVGKACGSGADCASLFCPESSKVCTAPRYDDGVQNGDETDIDCGGKPSQAGFVACAETKRCVTDTDCNGACKSRSAGGVTANTCIDTPSCKPVHGGDTCGLSEIEFNGGATHESCCKSLPVRNFTDPQHPGKTVYLDKYEITAGRMRTFVEAISAQYGGAPNVKAWMAAHRPGTRWNPEWEKALPADMLTSTDSYTISTPTRNPLYPGEDYYADKTKSYPDKWFASWHVTSGPQTIQTGLAFGLGFAHLFPEWTSSNRSEAPDHSASHALNCSNHAPGGNPNSATGSGGFSTYWFDTATMKAVGGRDVVGKVFSKDQLDEKSLNCSPLAMFAAFCIWDGGQLATAEVSDAVTSNETKLADAEKKCGGGNGNLLLSTPDSTGECPSVYYYPDAGRSVSWDKSFKIAPPGRVARDDVDGWMDLKGNLVEAVLGKDGLFDHRGYGIGWHSIRFHKVQSRTPRYKSATVGARCMRFK
jgi:hypothetical protein